jgi:hypothetical protein
MSTSQVAVKRSAGRLRKIGAIGRKKADPAARKKKDNQFPQQRKKTDYSNK